MSRKTRAPSEPTVTFPGAARTAAGSVHPVEVCGRKLLERHKPCWFFARDCRPSPGAAHGNHRSVPGRSAGLARLRDGDTLALEVEPANATRSLAALEIAVVVLPAPARPGRASPTRQSGQGNRWAALMRSCRRRPRVRDGRPGERRGRGPGRPAVGEALPITATHTSRQRRPAGDPARTRSEEIPPHRHALCTDV